jgi:ABC-type Zn uptake system ZnuABC Zn-binding protein ZnuA
MEDEKKEEGGKGEEESRYEKLKGKFSKKEEIDLDLPEQIKKLIRVYEKNNDMFLKKMMEKDEEFHELVEKHEEYGRMLIVHKAIALNDSFDALLFNMSEQTEFLYDVIKDIVGKMVKEAKAEEKIKLSPDDEKREVIISLRDKGWSLRRIATYVTMSYESVRRILDEIKKSETNSGEKEVSH